MSKTTKERIYTQSEVEQLRQELKEKIDGMSFGITGTKFTDDLCRVSGVLRVIDSVFAKYGVDDSNESHLNEGRSEGVNPSNPNKFTIDCPICKGQYTMDRTHTCTCRK